MLQYDVDIFKKEKIRMDNVSEIPIGTLTTNYGHDDAIKYIDELHIFGDQIRGNKTWQKDWERELEAIPAWY
jgi:hypothetical protein